MYDIPTVLAEQRLGGGTYAQLLGQLLAAAHRNPGALGGEALYVVLLLLEQALGYEHGHGNDCVCPVSLNFLSSAAWMFPQIA